MRGFKRITTKRGFEIVSAPNHRLWNGFKWVSPWELVKGDFLPIKRGQQVWNSGVRIDDWVRPDKRKSRNDLSANFIFDEDMAYLLGLILAEGYWSDRGGFNVSSGDREIGDWLVSRGFVNRD